MQRNREAALLAWAKSQIGKKPLNTNQTPKPKRVPVVRVSPPPEAQKSTGTIAKPISWKQCPSRSLHAKDQKCWALYAGDKTCFFMRTSGQCTQGFK